LENKNTIQLLEEARSGSQPALALLYKQYSKQMYGICSRMLSVKDDADDALQEAFIHAFNNLAGLRNDNAFGGWLRRIVINECIKHSKKKVAWIEVTNIDSGDIGEEINGEEDWFSAIDLSIIHEEIKKLPEGYRQVFNLYAVEDFSHKEIAAQLSITESTSKTQYYKAKRYLRNELIKKQKNGPF
jgi:RNA polymerase sigma factor (sigma-70 family)